MIELTCPWCHKSEIHEEFRYGTDEFECGHCEKPYHAEIEPNPHVLGQPRRSLPIIDCPCPECGFQLRDVDPGVTLTYRLCPTCRKPVTFEVTRGEPVEVLK